MINQELRKKIALTFKEPFVGNIIFHEEELEEIYDEIGHDLRRVCKEKGANISQVNYELLFVAIVNLAKDWDSSEDAFFDYIYRKLVGNVPSTAKAYNQITSIIDNLYHNNKIYMLSSYRKKYYATLCCHSFAPISSVESFFEMCWEIYRKDLEMQYGKNDPVYKMITDSLHKKFLNYGSNEDNIQVGSKTYFIRVGIRGLAIDHQNKMTQLLDMTLEIINSLYYNKSLEIDNYIKVLISNWWKKKEITFGVKRDYSDRKRNENIITDYSKIRTKYIYEDGCAKLFIPAIRLLSNYDLNPRIMIKSNNQPVYDDIIETKGSGIIMATRYIEIKLNDIVSNDYNNLSVEIIHAEETIYNSKNTLYREFILFKDTREILSDECTPGFYFLYCRKFDKLLQYPQYIQLINNDMYSFEAIEGELLQSNNKTVIFLNEKRNSNLYFYAKEQRDVIYRFEGEEYKVIDGELFIEADADIDIIDYGVRYEDIALRLAEFKSIFENGKQRYLISSLLNVGEKQKIVIFKYSDNSIYSIMKLIKFNNINVIYNKSLYYGKDEIANVRFVTEKYNIQTSFDISDFEVSLSLECGELIIFPPVLRWRIDEGEWYSQEYNKAIWYKNITNSSMLQISIPFNLNYEVALTNNKIIEPSVKNNEYKLGQTIYSLSDNLMYSSKSFTVIIRTSDNEFYHLAEVYFKETFTNEPIIVNRIKKCIAWIPETYIGDSGTRFILDIKDNNNSSVFKKTLKTENELISLNELDDGDYHYELIKVDKGFMQQNKKLRDGLFRLGSEQSLRFKCKTLLIEESMLFDSIDYEIIKPLYVDKIKYLGSFKNHEYYSGSLYIKDKNNEKRYLNHMFNLENKSIQVNPIRIELKNLNSCYIGYGLDEKDPEYEYDEEFTLDVRKRISINKFELNYKCRNIDYFKFKVEKNV